MSYLIFLLCSPIFFIYILACFSLPIIRIGKIIADKGDLDLILVKDNIHADFIFDKKLIEDIFPKKEKYVKIGWGDRKIFLETREWKELSVKNFLKAFWGLNKTVLRVEGMNELPKKFKIIKINKDQLEIIKKHIINSSSNRIIEKKENYYQFGDYYESNLNYNCINTCNNWINQALRKAKITNRIWCPIAYWL